MLPPGILHWRIFFNYEDEYLCFHRKVLMHRMEHIPLFKYILIFITRIVLWYFYFGWIFYCRTFRHRARWVIPHELDYFTQFYDLFYLTFIFCAPPHNYYFLRLYTYEKRDWFRFIFDHESPKWQDLLSLSAEADEKKYLSSKHSFFLTNESQGINSIPTLYFIEKRAVIDWSKIFVSNSIFLKPESLYESKGCYALLKDSQGYNLVSKNSTLEISKQGRIKDLIRNEVQKSNYLIQPLIENEKEFENYFGCKELITLRLITVKSSSGIDILSGLLYLPKEGRRKIAKILRVGSSGMVNQSFIYEGVNHISRADKDWLKSLTAPRIIYWDKIVELCERSHELCPNIRVVGWDVAIIETGPILIEGNNGFSMLNHQMDGKIDFIGRLMT